MKSKTCLATAISFITLSLGCAQKPTYISSPPILVDKPIYSVYISKSKPSDDARCSCGQSQGVTLTNNDPTRTRASKVEVTVRDATVGTIIAKSTRDDLLGPTSGSSSLFLGCTIAQDSVPTCQKINSFRLLSEAVINAANAKERAAGLPAIFNNDAATCSRRCVAGGDCLDLGMSGAPLVAPLVALLDASINPTGSVKMETVLKGFGLKPSDDTCNRGDITVDPTTVENVGPAECNLKLSDSVPSSTLPIDIRVGVMKKVVASKGSAKSITPSGSVSQLLAFGDREQGMSIEFNNANGTISSDLMNLYGGEIVSALRIDKQVFLATANGCVTARTK